MDSRFYDNVKSLMEKQRIDLPRPRLKPTIIVNYDEWLPIIALETGI